ncbi:MAG: T9SS type A sorting domain-containing protein [Flavobacteriales bacterium]
MYPNPNFGQFYVPSSENCNIRISNVMGQKIIEKQKIYKGVNNEINLSLFPKGVYIIEVMNSSNKLLESQKLIV